MTAPRADTVRWRGDAGTAHGMQSPQGTASGRVFSSCSSYVVLAVCWLLFVRGGWIFAYSSVPTSLLGRTEKGNKRSSLSASPAFFPGHARAGWLPSGGCAIPQGGVGGRSACSRGWRGGRPDTGKT